MSTEPARIALQEASVEPEQLACPKCDWRSFRINVKPLGEQTTVECCGCHATLSIVEVGDDE